MKINKILAALFLLNAGFCSEAYFMQKENRNEKKEKNMLRFDTPLHQAAYSGNLEEFKRLLREGAFEAGCVKIPHTDDYEQSDSNGLTLLHWAAKGGSVAVARYLLESGAHVNAVAREEQATALHYASETGNHEMINLLLRFKADTTQRDEWGSAPIEWAFRVMHEGILHVHTLKVLGIDFEKKEFNKQQAFLLLTSFAQLKKEEVLALIEAHPDLIDRADDEKQTPSHWAALRGDDKVVELLKNHGADQSLCDKEGQTAADILAEQDEDLASLTFLSAGVPLSLDEVKKEIYSHRD